MNGIIPSDSLSRYETFRFSWNTGCIILERSARSFGGLYTMDRQRRKTLCIAVREEPKGRKAHHAGGRIPVSLRIAIGRLGRDLGKEGFGSIFLRAACGNGTQKTLSCALGRKADSETLHKEKEGQLGNYIT